MPGAVEVEVFCRSEKSVLVLFLNYIGICPKSRIPDPSLHRCPETREILSPAPRRLFEMKLFGLLGSDGNVQGAMAC